ncbi:MAG: T9SS type A sorting domain-containing protein [Flavobacteriales bacterium]|nr:T9SS type A sorting domain-containing protein [Flavobacteriales bacterium]
MSLIGMSQCSPLAVNSYTCNTTFCENTSYCPGQTTWFTIALNGTATGVKIYDNSTGTGTPVATFTGSASFYSGYIPIPATSSNYYVFVLGAGGCQLSSSSLAYSFTINTRPTGKPSGLTATPDPVCSGSNITLSANTPPSGYSTKWSTAQICGMGSGIGGEYTGNTIDYTETNFTSFDVTKTMYAYYYDPSTQCRGEATAVSYTVKKDFMDCNGVSYSSTTVNTNTNITYNATGVAPAGSTYFWDFGSDATPQTSTSSSGSVKWSTAGAKNVTLTVTYNGCSEECPQVINVVQACPTAVITAPTSNCLSLATSITAVYQGTGVTYTWNFGSGASPTTASGIGPHNVTYSTTGTKTISLTTSKSGCSNSNATKSISIGSNFSTPTITGPTTAYAGVSETFSVNTVTGASYTWLPDGGSITGSGNSVGISWPNSGDYVIEAKVNNGYCEKSDTHNISIFNAPCYPSFTKIGNLTLGTNMNGYTFTDGAGTTATFGRSAAASGNSFHNLGGTLNFPRGGDTCVKWSKFANMTWDSAWIIFNGDVSNISFSIRDLDKNGSSYMDSVFVVMYAANGTKYNLDDFDYTAHPGVGLKGQVFYSITSNESYATNGCDIDISLKSGLMAKKVVIYRRNNGINASYALDIGISELDWCSINPLPVEFVYANGRRISENTVSINWATANEIENDRFVIERSENGTDFEEIGTVLGNGNSQQILEYSFLDNFAYQPNLFYRIKQIDFNGNFEYTDVITVSQSVSNEVVLFPNPADKVLNITWDKAIQTESIEIVSTHGQVIWSTDNSENLHHVSINLDDFGHGIYIVKITQKNGIAQFHRFIKSE